MEFVERFEPLHIWRNRHIQTLARGFRTPNFRGPTSREYYRSVHEDFLSVDRIPVEEPLGRVLFLHGITGCSGASPIPEASSSLARLGVEPWALNLRGADRKCPSIPRLYHAGCSDDLESVFRQLPQDKPWRFVGFSLGANLLLKWLGESGHSLPEARALAVSCPFDLAECAQNLERSLAGRAYRWVLIARLKALVRKFAHQYPSVLSLETLESCRTFYDFDDRVTAPIHGFEGAEDYWRRNSSLHALPGLRVPTLLLHALDDLFQPRPPTSVGNQNLEWELYPSGGHVGFQNRWRDDWLVHRILDFAQGGL